MLRKQEDATLIDTQTTDPLMPAENEQRVWRALQADSLTAAEEQADLRDDGLSSPARAASSLPAACALLLCRHLAHAFHALQPQAELAHEQIPAAQRSTAAAHLAASEASNTPASLAHHASRSGTLWCALSSLSMCSRTTLALDAHAIQIQLPEEYDAAYTNRRLAEADAALATLSEWARLESHVFAHKLLLLQAERNRVAIFSHLACHHLVLSTMQLYE